MLSLAKVPSQRDPIVFTDQTIEHSMVLERLLDIIIDCEMTPTEDIRLIKYVIHLAQKWDFTNALKVMRTDIRLAICDDSGRYLDDCLLHWGTELKDYECLSWLIRYGGDGTWCDYFGPQKSDSITSGNSTDGAGLLSHSKNGGGLEGAHLFEPGSMGVEGYLDLPPLVHWAIARATLLAEKETGKRKQWKLIGEKFKSLMEEACEHPSLFLL